MKKSRNSGYRLQDVQFASVDDFLSYLPDDELRMVERLRKLIFECVPGIREKLSYNVPFYSLNKGMFFIWPAAVLGGKTKSYEGVRFGFQQGWLLTDDEQYLDKGNRKQVYYKDYTSIKEIGAELLRRYLYEAVIVDEQSGRKRR